MKKNYIYRKPTDFKMTSDSEDSGDQIDWDNLKTITTFDASPGRVRTRHNIQIGWIYRKFEKILIG